MRDIEKIERKIIEEIEEEVDEKGIEEVRVEEIGKKGKV